MWPLRPLLDPGDLDLQLHLRGAECCCKSFLFSSTLSPPLAPLLLVPSSAGGPMCLLSRYTDPSWTLSFDPALHGCEVQLQICGVPLLLSRSLAREG